MTSNQCLIRVQGNMSRSITDNFGFSVSTHEQGDRTETILSGEVVDQAALMGILNNLYDLGFTILAVEYPSSDDESSTERKH
jgi:hypothetical protein